MRATVIVLLALLPAACAHQSEEVHRVRHAPEEITPEEITPVERVVEVEKVVEVPAPVTEPAPEPLRRPDAAYARIARYGNRPAPGGEVLTIPVPSNGLAYPDLFELVARETGVRIRYEAYNAVIKSKRVSIVGPVEVPKDDLLAWFQDLCFIDGIVALPYGPGDRRELVVLDVANANLTTRPEFVTEDELPELAGRTGTYVSCVLTIPPGLEANRVRQALSQLSTKTAGLGRVNDIGESGVLVVSDFVAIVANMRRLLDEMAIRRYEAQQR